MTYRRNPQPGGLRPSLSQGVLVEIVLFWIVCPIAACAIAASKGRSGVGWFFLGLCIGPFALIVALLPSTEAQAQALALKHGTWGDYRVLARPEAVTVLQPVHLVRDSYAVALPAHLRRGLVRQSLRLHDAGVALAG